MVLAMRKVVVGPRRDLSVSRHVMRDEVVYVVRDPISFETHAFGLADYVLLSALNGERTLREAFERLVSEERLSNDDEERFYRFVVDLHRAGLLSLPISDDKQLHAKYERRAGARRRSLWMAPLYLKIPLWNPDAFLARTLGWFAWLYTPWMFAVWCVFAAACAGVVIGRSSDLGGQLQGLLAPQQLASMWVLLAVMKFIHELGHGYAVRRWGGTVPEMGVSLILLTPCAYVDASSSWGFSSRLRRIVVCLGGMYFESWIAGIALFVWAATDPGALNTVAYQLMVLASVTTVLFNINPLMRFDGYYILSDLLQVPNLRSNANAAVQRVLKRIFLGIDPGGRAWSPSMLVVLSTYSIAAALFRIVTVLGICALIATKFFVVGIAAGIAYGGGVLLRTLGTCLDYLCRGKETAPVRIRACVVAALLVIAPTAAIAVPFPWSLRISGVAERAEEAWVTVREAGRIAQRPIEDGGRVAAGALLVALEAPDARESLERSEAALGAARTELEIAETISPVDAILARHALDGAASARDAARDRTERLLHAAPIGGIVQYAIGPRDLGRVLQPGERIALVAEGGWRAKLFLDQDEAAALRDLVGETIEVRGWSRPEQVLRGRLASIADAGSLLVDESALTVHGGGDIAVSPSDGSAASQHFEAEIEFDECTAVDDVLRSGLRVEARLPGPSESLARRWYRAILRFNEQLRTQH
jgi:putative peptide zinc metalloprotease protein